VKARTREILAELEKLGTAQNVKVYRRHGAGDNVYGVSFANLGKLQKRLNLDHELALELWDSGNADARTLAVMIADPELLKASTANAWVRETDYYVLADALGKLVASSPFALKKLEQWTNARKEFVQQAGYVLLAVLLVRDEPLDDALCRQFLKTIEAAIHTAPNRAKHSMNMTLIAIGIYRPKLTKAAIAAAKRIGKVDVDHGETACKTPDAIPYIEKALARKKPNRRPRC
jgi:3-methyladenine DNA glycosylase AlkD